MGQNRLEVNAPPNIDSVIFVPSLQRCDAFIQALRLSEGVDLDMIGKVCRKSPANNIRLHVRIRAPPISRLFPVKSHRMRSSVSKTFLCAMMHSSQIMSLHVFSIVAIFELTFSLLAFAFLLVVKHDNLTKNYYFDGSQSLVTSQFGIPQKRHLRCSTFSPNPMHGISRLLNSRVYQKLIVG
ncbi:hypothetical protein CEXT_341561 [Caerostris extrusa]|uniref:Uncharacterized protein n=1 Tax=Caerostris extrusa TaxID=172846 RepID=A0AAV4SRB1_CAEEX|nr:hypothetical protein CEXT_341561 [Caerostris extrusa]